MSAKSLDKKTLTVSLFAAGLLAAANVVTLTSAANAFASHTDVIESTPMQTLTETMKVAESRVAASSKKKKKKKKKKRRRGSFS